MKKMRVFLDLDGVLVDWASAALKLCGIDPTDPKIKEALIRDYNSLEKIAGPKLWEVISKEGPNFWLNLELFPWSEELIIAVQEAAGVENVAFLTSPGNWAEAAMGKIQWQKKMYPDIPILLGRNKYFAAHERALLIDDDEKQINNFKNAGGHTFKWANQNHLLSTDPIFWKADIDIITTLIDKLNDEYAS